MRTQNAVAVAAAVAVAVAVAVVFACVWGEVADGLFCKDSAQLRAESTVLLRSELPRLSTTI